MKRSLKQLHIAAVLVAVCLLSASCLEERNKRRDNRNLSSDPVVFTASTVTKTVYDQLKTTFREGDKIGVYAVLRKEGETQSLKPSGNYADNLPFRYIEQENCFVAETEKIYLSPGYVVDFYAYYPYRPLIADASEIPHTCGIRQDNEQEYAESNFMRAVHLGYQNNAVPVHLSFKHLTGQLEILISKKTAYDIQRVTVKGRKNECRMNLITGAVHSISGNTPVTLHKFSENEYEYRFRCILPPQTIAKGEDLLEFTMQGSKPKMYKNGASPLAIEAGQITGYDVLLQSRIQVKSAGGGRVTVSRNADSGEDIYRDGEAIRIDAFPDKGYEFAEWQEDGKRLSVGNPYLFITYENKEIYGVFKPSFGSVLLEMESSNGYHPTLYLNKSTVTGAGDYAIGTTVNLKATPGEGFYFDKWSDGVTNASRTVQVRVGDNPYKAIFKRKSFQVAVSANGEGAVHVQGAELFGERIVISAKPAHGYYFDHFWNLKGSNISTPEYIIPSLDKDYNLIAVFYRIGT